jgi:DNA primase
MVAADSASPTVREALIIRALLYHPWLIEEHAETIAGLTFTSSAFSRLRDAILSAQALDNSLDREALHSHLSKSGVGKILTLVERTITHKCDKFAEPDAGRTEVEDGWRHALALHERHVGLRLSLEAAEQAWHEDRSEEAYARICELQHDLERLVGAETFDNAAGIDPGP